MPIRQISPEELGHFGLDENKRLYWDNQAIQTESVVILSGKQTAWGIVIAIATILGAVATCVYTGTYVWTVMNPRHENIQQERGQQTQTSTPVPPAPQKVDVVPPNPQPVPQHAEPKKK